MIESAFKSRMFEIVADESGDRVGLQFSRGSVIASIQVDLTEPTLKAFRADLMECIHSNRARSVVVDFSGVDIMDASDLDHLKKTVTMGSVLGAVPVVVGIKPGVASALVELGANLDGILTARDVDSGIELLKSKPRDSEGEPDPDDEPVTGPEESIVPETDLNQDE